MQPQKLDAQLLSSVADSKASNAVVVTVRIAGPATESQASVLRAEGLRVRSGDLIVSGALSPAQIGVLSELPWVHSIKGTRNLRAIES